MFKKLLGTIMDTIKEEYKFIIFLLLLLFILNYPLNYYIIIGGGISDASDRIKVEEKTKSKGSFNISYVSQVNGNILFYGLSYLIPTWEREDANLYKYSEEENLEDIQFRGDLDLKTSNGTSKYWAYTLANKNVEEISSQLFVIVTYPEEYATPLKVGDEVISMDSHSYPTVTEYSEYIQTKEVGDTVDIEIIRKNKKKTVKAPVYQIKEQKILGISLQYVKDYATDPDVMIQFKKKESGPSGGLITTLEIYNQLTKEDLTKGYTIAGTGTIEPDGTIGQIGGIEQKLLGAASAKADIFITPGGENYQAAKKYLKKKKLKIKLIKADTIQEAIKKLEELK